MAPADSARAAADRLADVPAKTMARIERGEITKPRRRPLAAIARKLAVSPQDIETFDVGQAAALAPTTPSDFTDLFYPLRLM